MTYDVIILGAGLGGLTAGLFLRSAGVRVLLVEGRHRVGGRCQTIRTHGCVLPAGTVVIPCGDFLEGLFTRFNLPFDVVHLPTRGVYEIGGQFVSIPDRGALRALAMASMRDRPESVDHLVSAVRRALSWVEPSAAVSMRDWLMQFSHEPSLLGVFQALAGAYLATNSYEVSARAFIRYLKGAAGAATIGIPRNGWAALVEPLASRFEALDGELWTEAPARRILTEGRRVLGAVVRRGDRDIEVRAPVVVSDLGPRATVDKVAGDSLDVGYAADVTAVPSAPGVALFFRHEAEILPGGGPLLPSSAKRACFVITPTALAPALGDGRSHWTEILVTLEDSTMQTMAAVRTATESAIQDAHRLFPALRGVRPFKQIAYRREWPIYRTWPGWELEPRTPVENLFLAGDAVRQSDLNGTSAAAQTGAMVADQVLERLGTGG